MLWRRPTFFDLSRCVSVARSVSSFPYYPNSQASSRDWHYPVSSVLQACPPPCLPSLTLMGCWFSLCKTTNRASPVSILPIFHTCRHHYPEASSQCSYRSLLDGCQTSLRHRKVVTRLTRFEAGSVFTRVSACMVAEQPIVALLCAVLQTISLPL